MASQGLTILLFTDDGPQRYRDLLPPLPPDSPFWRLPNGAREMRAWAEILTKLGKPIKYPIGMPQLVDMLVVGMQNVVVNKADAKKMLDDVAAKWNAGVR